jgi:hypothetical protein
MAFDTNLRGMIVPFRRDGINDFANGSGPELVRSHLEQILGVRCSNGVIQGEYPWDPGFGSLVDLLRHRNVNDDVVRALATTYVVDAITKWTTVIRVRGVELRDIDQDGMVYRVLHIRYENTSSSRRSVEELTIPLRLAA